MLIVPPATAQLLSDRLARMVVLSCIFAVLSSVFGYWCAVQWNVEPAGAMAVVAGGMYGLAVLFAPQYGILSALVRNLQTTLRILREDLLLLLYRADEMDPTQPLRAGRSGDGGRWRFSRALGTRRCFVDAGGSKRATATCG